MFQGSRHQSAIVIDGCFGYLLIPSIKRDVTWQASNGKFSESQEDQVYSLPHIRKGFSMDVLTVYLNRQTELHKISISQFKTRASQYTISRGH